MRQSGEPSVEEILQSIKQVIARDNQALAPLPPETQDADDDIFDLPETAELDVPHGNAADLPLIDEGTRASMRESLASLAMLSEPGSALQATRPGEASLESIVREMLRPALAEWLDRNLPSMVERLVSAEIARIVGKKD